MFPCCSRSTWNNHLDQIPSQPPNPDLVLSLGTSTIRLRTVKQKAHPDQQRPPCSSSGRCASLADAQSSDLVPLQRAQHRNNTPPLHESRPHAHTSRPLRPRPSGGSRSTCRTRCPLSEAATVRRLSETVTPVLQIRRRVRRCEQPSPSLPPKDGSTKKNLRNPRLWSRPSPGWDCHNYIPPSYLSPPPIAFAFVSFRSVQNLISTQTASASACSSPGKISLVLGAASFARMTRNERVQKRRTDVMLLFFRCFRSRFSQVIDSSVSD